jgi:hypothetical protein
MKKIGIVGENYQNDACAFSYLMTPQYKDAVQFIPIIKKPNTGTEKLGRLILSAIEIEELDAVICLKDLDTYPELKERELWFSDLNKIIKKGIFYLVVIRFEALLLADMNAVNRFYNTTGKYIGTPIKESKPDKALNTEVKGKYNKNDCSKICQNISFQKVYQTHTGERSFQSFIKGFDEKLKNWSL